MKILFLLGLFQVFALASSEDEVSIDLKSQFCSQIPEDFQTKLNAPENRIAFRNPPGRLNTGLCWWHSRFQRNSNYLVIFDPIATAPSPADVPSILKNIISLNKIVVIGGFNNLQEFTQEYREELTDALSSWEMSDSFIRQRWVKGLEGGSKTTAEKLKKIMEEFYVNVHDKKMVPYAMLQMPGFAAHAWLFNNLEKIKDGFQYQVVDSNFLELLSYPYHEGDQRIDLSKSVFSSYKFVPYEQYESDYDRYLNIYKNFCSDSILVQEAEKVWK